MICVLQSQLWKYKISARQVHTYTHTLTRMHTANVYTVMRCPTIITSCGENAARLFLEVLLEKLLVARKGSSPNTLRQFKQSSRFILFPLKNLIKNKTYRHRQKWLAWRRYVIGEIFVSGIDNLLLLTGQMLTSPLGRIFCSSSLKAVPIFLLTVGGSSPGSRGYSLGSFPVSSLKKTKRTF